MPFCCKTNVEAIFTLGIFNVVLNIFPCFGGSHNFVTGIMGVMISGLLVFGAYNRNSTAISLWMILAIIHAYFGVLALVALITFVVEFGLESARFRFGIYLIFWLFYWGFLMFFHVSSIIVANKAKKEIDDSHSLTQSFSEEN